MARLAQAGIEVGVLLMPVLPFIEDKPEAIRAIVERAADAGASHILAAMGTTMRGGSREWFYARLDEQFPGMRQQYERAFGLQYECPSPRARALYDAFHETRRLYGISDRIAPYEPHPRRSSQGGQQLALF